MLNGSGRMNFRRLILMVKELNRIPNQNAALQVL